MANDRGTTGREWTLREAMIERWLIYQRVFVRKEHPDWTREQVETEVKARRARSLGW